jgi:cytochrome c-type biogenesis protein CcmH
MRLLLILLALMLTPPALAIEPDELLADPALEARARTISRELRCVVCQSESIDDSSAPLARDLRLLVRERLLAGDSDEAVIAHIVARYGDYVLMRPPVQTNTMLLWASPAAALLVAALAALLILRRRRLAPGEAPEEIGAKRSGGE